MYTVGKFMIISFASSASFDLMSFSNSASAVSLSFIFLIIGFVMFMLIIVFYNPSSLTVVTFSYYNKIL